MLFILVFALFCTPSTFSKKLHLISNTVISVGSHLKPANNKIYNPPSP